MRIKPFSKIIQKIPSQAIITTILNLKNYFLGSEDENILTEWQMIRSGVQCNAQLRLLTLKVFLDLDHIDLHLGHCPKP